MGVLGRLSFQNSNSCDPQKLLFWRSRQGQTLAVGSPQKAGFTLAREELEYQLDSDSTPYCAMSKSRFDTPEHTIIFGDTLRRLLLFRGTRMALKRKGFQKDVKLIANSTSEQCMAALQASAGQPGDLRNANLEALSNNEKIALELRTALRQVFLKDRFTCRLPASRSKIETWQIKDRYEIWLRFENTMKIGFDSEIKAIY